MAPSRPHAPSPQAATPFPWRLPAATATAPPTSSPPPAAPTTTPCCSATAQAPGQPARASALVQTAGLTQIAVIASAANGVSLYAWSNTNHRFDGLASFATGQLPVRIESADLNGDGLGALVVGNNLDHSVTIAI